MNQFPWLPRENQSITIHNEADIFALRTEVRSLARQAGLDLPSQASISLAMSTLAYALGLDGPAAGEVTISRCEKEDDTRGIRIVYSMDQTGEAPDTRTKLNDASWLVDELHVANDPPGRLTVTAIKWTG